MRKGRLILIILLVIVVLVVGALLVLRMIGNGVGSNSPAPTAGVRFVEIIIAEQNIAPGTQITEDMLTTMSIPEDKQISGEYNDGTEIVGQFARMQIAQNLPIMEAMLSPTPGISTSPGSTWASQIPQNLTAIAIPTSRLDLAAYAIRDNDFVNVIVTMLLVDADASWQTILPNYVPTAIGAGALPDSLPYMTIQLTYHAEPPIYQGRTELDPTLNSAVYVVPSENQRPRMVSQMVMQNIQVLHVGSFPLPGEEEQAQVAVAVTDTTPTPGGETQLVDIERPDVITLMVTSQDAVVLTYLMHSGADLTLTLRNPNDFEYKTNTDAATLQYLLSQYNIPVPAKLPYVTTPRVDELVDPILPNDLIVIGPTE